MLSMAEQELSGGLDGLAASPPASSSMASALEAALAPSAAAAAIMQACSGEWPLYTTTIWCLLKCSYVVRVC